MSDRDTGSASLWALSMAMVLWVCVAAVVLGGVAVIARHRAATAADMSALAAASVTTGNRCAAADVVALANAAVITNCHVMGSVVDVTASVRIPALGLLSSLGFDSVSARARAGPG